MKCPSCSAEVTGRFCSYCDSEMPAEKVNPVNSNNTGTTIINNYYGEAPKHEAPKHEFPKPETPRPVPGPVNKYSKYNIANQQAGYGYSPVQQGSPKNKWVSFFLCLFTFGGHKMYEGKVGLGLVYILTAGFFGIMWFIDLVQILTKPDTYYV